MTSWLIYACRTDYTTEIQEILLRSGFEKGLLLDNLLDETGRSAGESGVLSLADLDKLLCERSVVVPLLTPGFRYRVVGEAQRAGLSTFPSLIDPTSVIAASAVIGEGTVINAGVVIGGETRVGRFVHINRSASVGHHNNIEDFSTVGPGVVLAGRVHLSRGVFVGAGAVCTPNVHIGPNATVGAGAVVVRNVSAGTVVVGNPARTLREDGVGYGGSAVPL